jgi:hypothetical protein
MIHQQFHQAFSKIKYVDANHTYSSNGIPLTSVTTLLKKLKEEFDTEYWLVYTTLKMTGYRVQPRGNRYVNIDGVTMSLLEASALPTSISTKELQDIWHMQGKIGTTRGSHCHDHIEQLWNRQDKGSKYPIWISTLDTKTLSEFHNSVLILKKLSLDFYNQISQTHSPVFLEYTVGDEALKIAGTADAILYNNITNQYEIWDWKTDKQYRTSGRDKIKEFDVADCEQNKYSLQLGLYKYIIEKNTDIKIDKCKIVHFDWKASSFDIYDTIDYNTKIDTILNNVDFKSTYL